MQSSVNCTMEGLPPRMRGKVISSLQCDFLSGITPACAGKSIGETLLETIDRDHPRRVRGKAADDRRCRERDGITPAYAGKS